MSNGTVTVRLLARHNLGNYEHTEASVEITQALHEREDAAAAVISLQKRIAPLITAKHVAGLMAAAPAAQPQPLPTEPEASDLDDFIDRSLHHAPPAKPEASDLALNEADMLTPAGKQAASVDPLAEPAAPKKRGPGRPRKEAPKEVLAAAAAGDPLTETAALPKSRTENGKTQFQTILAWVKEDLENAAALTRVLSATGYARLIDVPPEQLGDLMVALGLSD